eukprot:TRINITY_DN2149_c0_g1_i7.p1 TRINITY_DN2149_c0_g1~~TRINITY_DN2149_c0_g1_i7.p1  ORF type:complete len:825 (+),score=142.87 TRINITY_DN2149_c0_g1_i7:3-2477(+)
MLNEVARWGSVHPPEKERHEGQARAALLWDGSLAQVPAEEAAWRGTTAAAEHAARQHLTRAADLQRQETAARAVLAAAAHAGAARRGCVCTGLAAGRRILEEAVAGCVLLRCGAGNASMTTAECGAVEQAGRCHLTQLFALELHHAVSAWGGCVAEERLARCVLEEAAARARRAAALLARHARGVVFALQASRLVQRESAARRALSARVDWEVDVLAVLHAVGADEVVARHVVLHEALEREALVSYALQRLRFACPFVTRTSSAASTRSTVPSSSSSSSSPSSAASAQNPFGRTSDTVIRIGAAAEAADEPCLPISLLEAALAVTRPSKPTADATASASGSSSSLASDDSFWFRDACVGGVHRMAHRAYPPPFCAAYGHARRWLRLFQAEEEARRGGVDEEVADRRMTYDVHEAARRRWDPGYFSRPLFNMQEAAARDEIAADAARDFSEWQWEFAAGLDDITAPSSASSSSSPPSGPAARAAMTIQAAHRGHAARQRLRRQRALRPSALAVLIAAAPVRVRDGASLAAVAAALAHSRAPAPDGVVSVLAGTLPVPDGPTGPNVAAAAQPAARGICADTAATKIQAVQRGRRARRKLRDAAEDRAPPSEPSRADVGGGSAVRHAAATRIQAVHRGRMARRSGVAQQGSVLTLLAAAVREARGVHTVLAAVRAGDCAPPSRREAEVREVDDAVAEIEGRRWGGTVSEVAGVPESAQPLEKHHAAATKIQALHRGRAARCKLRDADERAPPSEVSYADVVDDSASSGDEDPSASPRAHGEAEWHCTYTKQHADAAGGGAAAEGGAGRQHCVGGGATCGRIRPPLAQ